MSLDLDLCVGALAHPVTSSWLYSHLLSKALWCLTRGGYRIPYRRGHQSLGGVPTYKFAGFSQKLHEIKKMDLPLLTNMARLVRCNISFASQWLCICSGGCHLLGSSCCCRALGCSLLGCGRSSGYSDQQAGWG